MLTGKIISVVSVLTGLGGSILLGLGMLRLTPEIIAEQVATKYGFNLENLKNIATQKANSICGLWMIIVAFFLQLINIIFDNFAMIRFAYFEGISYAIAVSLYIILIFLMINNQLEKQYIMTSQKIIAKKRLFRSWESHRENKLTYTYFKSVISDAEGLFDVKKRNDDPIKFLKRYANYLGLVIPENVDLSELREWQ